MEYKQVWRFYVSRPENDSPGQKIQFEPDEVHFANAVLRLAPNEQVELADGDGWTARAVLSRVDKKVVLAEIVESKMHSEPQRKLAAIVGITKPGALDEVVQACVEAGIQTLVLFKGDKTSSRQEMKTEKIEKQIREICRITKSPWCLKLQVVDSLRSAMQTAADGFSMEQFFVCDERPANGSLSHEVQTRLLVNAALVSTRVNLAFLVGPEASFSQSEYEYLMDGNFSGQTEFVSLGARILRTPAAVAAAAFVLSAIAESGISGKN